MAGGKRWRGACGDAGMPSSAEYATDLTDAQWALLAPELPVQHGPGRPREVDLRRMLDGLRYLNRTGCQWCLLPKVFAADIPDAEGPAVLLAAVAAGFPRIRQLWAAGAFLGWFVDWCQQVLHWVVTIPSRPTDQRGFVVLPRRWVAERSLAWLSRPR